MMMSLQSLCLLMCIFMFGISSVITDKISDEEKAAQEYLNLAQSEYIRVYSQAKSILWDPDEYTSIESISAALDTLRVSQNFSIQVANTLKSFDAEHFRNDDLRRDIQILKDVRTLSLDFSEFTALSASIVKMKNFSTDPVICSYKDKNTCNLALLPDIVQIYHDSEDSDELEYYWKEWRDTLGEDMKYTLGNYLALYKDSSKINGYESPARQWYSRHENPFFLEKLSTIIMELRPIYQELHAYIRAALVRNYGSIVEIDGGIPQHLLDQTIIQAWHNKGILSDPYPEKKLPNMKKHLEEQEFNSYKMVEIADEFFESLGFPQLPSSFWTNFVRMIPADKAPVDCKSQVFDFYTDIAMKYCPIPTFKRFIQMHGDMGLVYYMNQKKNLPFGLRDEPIPGFGKALGEAAVLSSSTPKHMQRVRLLDRDYDYDDELSLNRLFRLGVHTLLQIPIYYINEKIWFDLLEGNVYPETANCKYWQYMWEYMGVQPPLDRSHRNIDFGYRFYEGLDERKPHSTKIVSEILGYQFYKGLCEKSGEYVRDNNSLILQNCDFFRSRVAGDALKQVMEQGSRKPWYNIIQTITGSRNLESEPILEFFAPLYNWLKQENEKSGIQTGWRRTHTAISKRCTKYA